MTIDEAITYHNKVANQQIKNGLRSQNDIYGFLQCAKEHKQHAEWLEKLKEYEDLEKQGRLIKLPCKIGSDVWFVPSQANYKLNILNHCREENKIHHQKVARITFCMNGWYVECDKDLEYAIDHILIDKMYKETWFLTKSEAEAKLKELRGGK